MKVLVCGGRKFKQPGMLYQVLSAQHARHPITFLIHGAAWGADTLAGIWAQGRGIPTQTYPADWKRDGLAAGPMRNQRMIDEGKPELVIAFPGGKGTRDMVAKAIKAGIQVQVVPG